MTNRVNVGKKRPFSPELQKKIDLLIKRRSQVTMGSITWSSPLILAPMASICNAPFRLLMEELGAGGTVSELVSCHGINHGNQRTLNMLKIDQRESLVGLQLFGEEAEAMASSAKIAETYAPDFIDINMGCPVRKVVTKGGGSALMQRPQELGNYFSTIKKAIEVPLTIKIRTGWDSESVNALEVIHIAKNEGIEFVAVHGRTRAQQYQGKANWEFLEELAHESPLPLIGNGDLHTPELVRKRLGNTKCHGLMLARGPLRNPFIFLESYIRSDENIEFTPEDYWEIVQRLHDYICEFFDAENIRMIQLRKHIMWFANGFPKAGKFRAGLFEHKTMDKLMEVAEAFFQGLVSSRKMLDPHEPFMASGHG